jgi:hypothetical protein
MPNLSTGDRIGLGTLVVHLLILVVSIIAVIYAVSQLRVAVKGTQYQNAILVIDQSTDILDRLRTQPQLLGVLENKVTDQQAIQMVENALEKYQSLLFKASILQENDLMPVAFWKAFVADFCAMYKYPYIEGWWVRQRREPYISLSPQYKNLSDVCAA